MLSMVQCIGLNMYKYIILFNTLTNNLYYKKFISFYISSISGI